MRSSQPDDANPLPGGSRLGAEALSGRTPGRSRNALTRAALLGGLTFAAWLLVPQIQQFPAAMRALAGTSPAWLAVAVGCALGAYAAAAMALQGTVGTRLPLHRNLQVQVAAATASAMTPAGAGGLALHTRFLEGRGVPRAQAIAAVGIGRLAAAAVHVTALILLAPTLGRRNGITAPPVPLLILAAGLALATVLLLRRSSSSTRVQVRIDALIGPLTAAARSITADRRRAAGLIGGSFLVSAFRASTFAAALMAMGVAVAPVTVVALFLAAEALGAISSAPAGLGVLDGALLTGVVALGVAPAAGIGALLIFRLLTLWGPVVPALVTLRALRRADVL